MQVVDEVSHLLRIIGNVHIVQIKTNLILDRSIKLFSGNIQLMEINDDKLKLCGHDILDKLLVKTDKLDKKIKTEKLENFISDIADSFLRLNHVGISYVVADIESEISSIKRIVQNTGFNLYAEPSGNPKSKWLFAGNTINWESPLFEIVLTKETNSPENLWRPHFQIDIDTSLKQEKLENYLIDCFGVDFIKWKLDIPNYGVVLEMGMLGSICGTKIYLGVGTNLRNTKYHREKLLQKIL
ncbi:MAG: hypothetical protein EPN88_15310 [Bacteroidetes bacterium]|nr:MAG: hypothetical protein EPN88_15310 [Bacteroidota bacterium]